MRVKDILVWLDDYAPFRYAASWDRCGLQVGDPEAPAERVLVALDPGSETLSEAVEKDCRCVVTHHPLLFKPLDTVRMDEYPGSLVIRALRSEMNLVAVHTNLDAARNGTNDHLSRLLSLKDVEPLEAERAFRHEDTYVGMGRVGYLSGRKVLEEFVAQVRDALGGVAVRVVGERGREIRRVALCTGSGGSFIPEAISAGAQVYVTGDVKYHEAQRALEAGLSIVDVGHFASEQLIVEPLADYLRSRASNDRVALQVFTARRERDPFRFVGETF